MVTDSANSRKLNNETAQPTICNATKHSRTTCTSNHYKDLPCVKSNNIQIKSWWSFTKTKTCKTLKKTKTWKSYLTRGRFSQHSSNINNLIRSCKKRHTQLTRVFPVVGLTKRNTKPAVRQLLVLSLNHWHYPC